MHCRGFLLLIHRLNHSPQFNLPLPKAGQDFDGQRRREGIIIKDRKANLLQGLLAGIQPVSFHGNGGVCGASGSTNVCMALKGGFAEIAWKMVWTIMQAE